MEVRKKAIEKHLKSISIPKNLLEEASYIGLECSNSLTKLTKVCAGVGLLIASKSRGLSYKLKEVSNLLNIKSKTLFKYYSRMKHKPVQGEPKKIKKLEEILENCQAEPEIRKKAYSLIENKQCKTPFQAVSAVYSVNQGLFIAQQQKALIPVKDTKAQNVEKSTLRLENIITGKDFKMNSLPCLSLLDLEKEIMAKALGISYNQ